MNIKKFNKFNTNFSQSFDNISSLDNNTVANKSFQIISSPTLISNKIIYKKLELGLLYNSNFKRPRSNSLISLGKCHDKILTEIYNAIYSYVNEINTHIYIKYFIPSFDKLSALYKSKSNRYLDISKAYNAQIKDTQFYLHQENNYQADEDVIQLIIDSLKEEKNHELEKIAETFDQDIREVSVFKAIRLKDKTDIIVLKERFKVDMYNLMIKLLSPMVTNNKIQISGD